MKKVTGKKGLIGAITALAALAGFGARKAADKTTKALGGLGDLAFSAIAMRGNRDRWAHARKGSKSQEVSFPKWKRKRLRKIEKESRRINRAA